jgi:hypothetical protein
MYQLTYQLPKAKTTKTKILNMDNEQRELYSICPKTIILIEHCRIVVIANAVKLIDCFTAFAMTIHGRDYCAVFFNVLPEISINRMKRFKYFSSYKSL